MGGRETQVAGKSTYLRRVAIRRSKRHLDHHLVPVGCRRSGAVGRARDNVKVQIRGRRRREEEAHAVELGLQLDGCPCAGYSLGCPALQVLEGRFRADEGPLQGVDGRPGHSPTGRRGRILAASRARAPAAPSTSPGHCRRPQAASNRKQQQQEHAHLHDLCGGGWQLNEAALSMTCMPKRARTSNSRANGNEFPHLSGCRTVPSRV